MEKSKIGMETEYPEVCAAILLKLFSKTSDDLFSAVEDCLKTENPEIEFNEEIFSTALGELEEKDYIVLDFQGDILWQLTKKGREFVQEETKKAEETRKEMEANIKSN